MCTLYAHHELPRNGTFAFCRWLGCWSPRAGPVLRGDGLQRTKLRYRPQKARGKASGARRRADGSPQGQYQRLARGLGLRQPSPAKGTPKTMPFQLEALSKALAQRRMALSLAVSEINSWESDDIPSWCRRHGGGSSNHYLPARVMSNQVTPGRERGPIVAKDAHCLGGRNFGRTAPSQICLIFALAVQVHDR